MGWACETSLELGTHTVGMHLATGLGLITHKFLSFHTAAIYTFVFHVLARLYTYFSTMVTHKDIEYCMTFVSVQKPGLWTEFRTGMELDVLPSVLYVQRT